MSEPMTPSMTRCDLAPCALIFGGVLVALTALGGAFDGASHWNEEVKVAQAENAQGADDLDVWTACKKGSNKGDINSANAARRCRETAYRQVSH